MQTMKDDTQIVKVGLAGFAAGAIVGSVLGVLFAPKEGAETRRIIVEKAGSATQGVRDKFSDTEKYIDEKTADMKTRAKRAKANLETDLDEQQADISDLEKRMKKLEKASA